MFRVSWAVFEGLANLEHAGVTIWGRLRAVPNPIYVRAAAQKVVSFLVYVKTWKGPDPSRFDQSIH